MMASMPLLLPIRCRNNRAGEKRARRAFPAYDCRWREVARRLPLRDFQGEEPALATWTPRRRAGRTARSTRSTGRRAANSNAMRWLARAGFAARGVMYVIIGWIAVEVAFHRSNQQAARSPATSSQST